jgi:septal ring factor EnvC (AmiA/AmiB activator)
MRTYLWAAAAVLLFAVPATSFADDEVKPEQLKKMYDDALGQLKAAQDRKAELAKENESLGAKVADLQKQLAAAQDQVQTLKREVADSSDRTYYLRAYHAAWQKFLTRYPEVMARWKLYLGHSELTMSFDFTGIPLLNFTDSSSSDETAADSDATTARYIEHPQPDGVGDGH